MSTSDIHILYSNIKTHVHKIHQHFHCLMYKYSLYRLYRLYVMNMIYYRHVCMYDSDESDILILNMCDY